LSLKPADLIIENAAQILTLNAGKDAVRAEEKLAILPGGSIAVANGRIVWVGPGHQISEQVDLSGNPRRIEASGRVVLPGFIDSHTHLVFAGTREKEFELRLQGASYQEIAAKGGGIKATVQKTRDASREELFRIGKRHLDQMLSLGTTTVEAKSGYGLSTKDEIKMLEVLRDLDRAHPVDVVPTFMGAHEIPPEYAGRKEDYVRLVIAEMIPAVAAEKLAVFCDVFCEQGVFSPEESRRIL
jgi:imidazolonepropionase